MEPWIPVVAALGGTVIGGLLSWFVEERRWTREAVGRRDRLAEEAAGELLKLVDEARDLFQGSVGFNDGPDQEVLYPLYRDTRRHIVDIKSKPARELLEKVATCYYNYSAARDYGYTPRESAYTAAEAGRAILGAIRRGETLPEVSKLEKVHAAIVEHYEFLAEAEEEYRKQSRKAD